MKHTDRDLLSLYVDSGDNRYFTTFFLRYHTLLWQKAMMWLKNRQNAEDFLQDFWYRLLVGVDRIRYDDDGMAGRFLSATFVCDIYDLFRSRRWKTQPIDDELLERLDAANSYAYNPVEAEMYLQDIAAARLHIVEQLSPADRQLLDLYENMHASVKELALRFNLSEKTIRNKLSLLQNEINTKLRTQLAAIAILCNLFGNDFMQ